MGGPDAGMELSDGTRIPLKPIRVDGCGHPHVARRIQDGLICCPDRPAIAASHADPASRFLPHLPPRGRA